MKPHGFRERTLGSWIALVLLGATPVFAQEAGPLPSTTDESADEAATDASETSAAADANACKVAYKEKRYSDALDACERYLEHVQRNGRTEDVPAARYKFAKTLDKLDRDDDALTQLDITVGEALKINDLKWQLLALNRAGNIHRLRGDYETAIAFFSSALKVPLAPEDVNTVIHARANRGVSRYHVGEYVEALEDLDAAREAYESVSHRKGLASAYINRGLVHEALGEYASARNDFRQALELAEQDPIDERRIAEATHNLGLVASSAGEFAVAASFYKASLKFSSNEQSRASTLNNLGEAYGELGLFEPATEHLIESLEIARQKGARGLEGYVLDSLATVQAHQGRAHDALENYQAALLIAQENGDRRGQLKTLANMGKLLADEDQLALATVFYKRSINISEAIRADLKSLPASKQSSYTRSVSESYRELSSLLIRQNRLLEAQRVIDLLKGQEADEFLGRVRGNDETAAGIPETPTEREILEDYDALSKNAIETGIELAELREKLRAIPRDERLPEDKARLDELQNIQNSIRQAFNRFISSPAVADAMEEAQRRIGEEAVELPQLDNVGARLKELPLDAVVLYPLILEDRMELLLATPTSEPIYRPVDVSREDLRHAVFEFRQALLSPTGNVELAAKRIYELVIQPIEPELARLGTDLILYSPDDALRYVPLAALHDGNQWLVERYRISNWTDSSIINVDNRMTGPLQVVGGAYTVDGHSFVVGDDTFNFVGLEFAGREMDTIADLIDGTLMFPGNDFVFDDIYRELFDFNVLHLATHAAVVTGQPSDSFILFGDGRRVTLQDIRGMSFDVDLVVLSACETALSGGMSDGVEVLGLGYAMQNSKAKSIVASLWRVSDGGTHALMSEFYQQLAKGATRVDALREAQLLLIQNDLEAVTAANRGVEVSDDVRSRLNHPYYWAPFILIGTGL
jgi:CHAT domain-containing protein/Tfp pilus assembly protein PilF